MTSEFPSLIDSHAHLDSSQFNDDRHEMIKRAQQNGISHILTIGCDMESSAKSIKIAEQYEHVYAAVGVHPHDSTEINPETLKQLGEMLKHPKVVALGEIGLDYFRNHSPQDVQRNAFREQIRLAKSVNKPIIVHDREAHDEVMDILIEENASDVGGVLHCFSGDVEMADKCLELGFYLSFPGPVTYPKNEAIRGVVRAIPIERLLVETDCPYLSPQKFRGKRNEPAYVRFTAEKIAEIKELAIADVARITSQNCYNLFGFGPNDMSAKIAYQIRNSLYLNITNRCTNSCVFCAKFDDFNVKGHNLKLDQEPSFDQIIEAIGDPSQYEEIVFCGFGEPLLKLDMVKKVATWLKRRDIRVRINSDGLANLVLGRNILPELHGLVDALSISLNAPDADSYQKICPSDYGHESYQAVKEFILQAKSSIPAVMTTAVTYPGIDIAACQQVADKLGVPFRAREYKSVV
jgi:TatD DNase family protein